MNFRVMTEDDLFWFAGVRNQVFDMLHNPQMFSLDETRSWFPNSETKYWVIENNNQKIGYFRIKSITNEKVLIGADIEPQFQGQGFGYSAYIDFVSQVLLPQGVTLLELRVLKKNEKAIRLYKKLGFKITQETEIDYLMNSTAKKLIKISRT